MKSFLILTLSLFCANSAFAQYELYGASIAGDTVTIWNTNIYASCGAKFIASVSIPVDSIVVVEQDTSTLHATCGCYYDIKVAMWGFGPTTLQAVIYRQMWRKYQYPNDTLILVGSFSVAVPASPSLLFHKKVITGDCHQTPVSVHQTAFANSFALLASYPNPFNPKATIRYSIPRTEQVNLDVFDPLGHKIATLVNEKKASGYYEIQFDAGQFASGVYLCRLVAGATILTNKLVLLK
jgi:hypothetical protein